MRTLPLLAFVPLLAACVVGPDYERPERPAPASWAEMAGDRVSSASPETEWWTSFGDPTLDSLIARALEANLDLRVAAARVREARAEAGVVRGALLPEIDAGGSVARNRFSENGTFPLSDPTSDLYSAGFDARWELDLFGGTRRELEAAEAEVEASLEDRRAVLVSLLGEVAASYVDLRGNQRLAAVARRNADAARAALELTRTRLAAGLGTELDLSRATALLARCM